LVSFNVERHVLWVRKWNKINIHASSFLEIKNRQGTCITSYAYFVDTVKWCITGAFFGIGVANESEIVHLLHIVFCVVVNLEISDHFRCVGQHCIVVAFVVLEKLVKICASFTT